MSHPSMTAPNHDHSAPHQAACLYHGEVMHARLKPMGHRFSYRVANLLIDLTQLHTANRMSPLFGINRAAPFSFHEKDHGLRDGSSLLVFAKAKASKAEIDIDGGRVLLLCYPRMLGYAFNPLSIYYCYNRDNRLVLTIYEVRNTFGEMHHYVCAVTDETGDFIHQEADKLFYVSPFIDMAMHYRFRISPPEERVKVHILESDTSGPLLVATFFGNRRPLSTLNLLRTALAFPFATAKIILAIHYEALRLWLKGAKIISRPAANGEDMAAASRTPHHRNHTSMTCGDAAREESVFENAR